jgi:4-hydroxy-tetrahydrodipicolinate synthase
MSGVGTKLYARTVGPMYPICPAFNADGSLDRESIRGYVRYLAAAKVRSVLVTAGTSRFSVLEAHEIHELNAIVAEAAGPGVLKIAANPMAGSTKEAVEFAKRAEGAGADAIILYFPDRYYSDDQMVEYFATVGRQVKIGIMIHGIPTRNATTAGPAAVPYHPALCKRLCEIDNIFAMKEEHADEALRCRIAMACADRMSLVVAGGSMWMYYASEGFGVRSYLVGVGSFKPAIEERFYDLMRAGERAAALDIIRSVELPYFDVSKKMGWHVAMKGSLHLLGLMPVHERGPIPTPTPAQLDELRVVMKQTGLL